MKPIFIFSFTFITFIQQITSQDTDISLVYSPFYLNRYDLSAAEGTSQIIRVAQDLAAVYFSSGFGGIIVLDQLGGKKLLQQQIRQEYVSSFDVSSDGMILVIGQKTRLSIFQYSLPKIDLNNMKQYVEISNTTFPSEILEVFYFEKMNLVFASGLNGYVAVYDLQNINNIRQIAIYDTQSVQVTSIYVSSDAQWIYLSCDIVGVVVLRFDLIQSSGQLREGKFILAAKGQGYRKTWALVVTNDNKYIYEIENWFGIYYADNSKVLISDPSTYPMTLNFQAYWPLKQVNPVCTILLISKNNNYLFVGVRSIGILIFDIRQRTNIQYFQHIQIDALSNSAILSNNEKYLYYANSLGVYTFKKSIPNLNNNFPNTFNTHQAIQKEMDGIYKWRCYMDPSNQYLMGSFDYSGTFIIPFFNNPLNLQISKATHLPIESDSMSFDVKNKLLFIPTLYSQKLINVYSYAPTADDPTISLNNLKEVGSYSVSTYQMAEQLIFSKDRQYAIQTYQSGMMLFDMRDPLVIKLVYYYINPEFMQGETGGGTITDDNNFIIGCVRNYGIYVLDCTDKNQIVLSDYLETLGGESIALSKITSKYAYLMDGMRGFAILDLTVLPKIKVISRVLLQGWTQLGIPIKQDNFILIGSQDYGMLTLIDMQDKMNPRVISTYRRDKQFSVSICTTNDEKFVFITNPQGIITLPLISNVMIHTEVNEILVNQLTGNKIVQTFEKPENQADYIFKVGQKIQLNFLILYPIDEDERIAQVNFYSNDQILDIPYYMNYDAQSQTLIMEIDKSALGDIRDGTNQNTILIKTVIPLQQSSFLYSLQDPYDVALTDQEQSNLILTYLIDQNYLDSKRTVTNFFDSTKPFKFDDQFVNNFQKIKSSSQIQDISLYMSQLQFKVLQTLILSSYINPVIFFVEPSLQLNFGDIQNHVYSLSSSLISVYLQVDKSSGKFVVKDYPGVITSTTVGGDQIKIEGSLSNINRVLYSQMIFANTTDITDSMMVQITIIDNVNYPLIVNEKLKQCRFIILKQVIKVNVPLQQQIEKQFQDSIADIESDLSITFSQDSFQVKDFNTIFYRIQLYSHTDGYYQDLSPDFWLQSQGDTRLNYFGKIPSSLFNTIFRFKIIANDTYTTVEDYFILKAQGVPFVYVVNLMFKILGPLFAILGIYQKRHIIWNMIFKNQTCFEDEHAYCDEQFSMKIILMGTILQDSIKIVQNLLLKINSKDKLYSVTNIQDEETNEKKDKEEVIMSQSLNTENKKKCCQFNKRESLINRLKNISTVNFQIPKPDLEKIINSMASLKNHIPSSIAEKKYIKRSGCICMQLVVEDILKYKLTLSANGQPKGQYEYTTDIKDVNSRIHKAVKAQISRHLLSLDKRSQTFYDFIKYFALRYLTKSRKYWYRALIEFDSSKYYHESGNLGIFSNLRINTEEILNLLILLKILPQSTFKQINNFEQLTQALRQYQTGINIFLIRDVLFADAYGLTSQVPSVFYCAQGESIHLPQYQIKQILAFKKVNASNFYRPILSFFNLEYKKYGVSKNIRLPTWLSLDQKHGVIMFSGTPSKEDIEDVLIRIYDLSGYVIKSFLLKVKPNTKQKSDAEFSIPDEDNMQILQNSQPYFYQTSLINIGSPPLLSPATKVSFQQLQQQNQQRFRNSTLFFSPRNMVNSVNQNTYESVISPKRDFTRHKQSIVYQFPIQQPIQLSYEFKSNSNSKNSEQISPQYPLIQNNSDQSNQINCQTDYTLINDKIDFLPTIQYNDSQPSQLKEKKKIYQEFMIKPEKIKYDLEQKQSNNQSPDEILEVEK